MAKPDVRDLDTATEHEADQALASRMSVTDLTASSTKGRTGQRSMRTRALQAWTGPLSARREPDSAERDGRGGPSAVALGSG